jgi:intracellular sulfur oxidation DsrE/DsrF family protein
MAVSYGQAGNTMATDKRAFFRQILVGLGMSAASLAAIGKSTALAAEPSGPASEAQDSWLDQLGHRHRQVFDTISPDGVARALSFTFNFYDASKNDYGITPAELGVVIVLRNGSTGFGFNDRIWSKYGEALSRIYKFTDPTTKAPANVNVYNAADKASQLPTNGLTFDALAKMGGRFAVCTVASHKLANAVARETGGNGDAIFAEFQANLIANARLVPAGIIAVNRAQEHRYALCYTA